jgi:hypothetical protein
MLGDLREASIVGKNTPLTQLRKVLQANIPAHSMLKKCQQFLERAQK